MQANSEYNNAVTVTGDAEASNSPSSFSNISNTPTTSTTSTTSVNDESMAVEVSGNGGNRSDGSNGNPGQLKLTDVLADLIDFCLKMSDAEGGPLTAGINPVKVRVNKFREVFETKRNGPNNMKQMVTTAYNKCSGQIEKLENNVTSMHKFMTWFSDQNVALQPRNDPKSVSIPLSMICRDCLRMAEDNVNEHAGIADAFMLHLLRIFAFSASDEIEDKIDDHIAYLEGMLGLDPNETPDVTGFLVNIMDKLTSRFGPNSKQFGNSFKKMMKGPIDRRKRKDMESAIIKVADNFLDKIPKEIMTNPDNFNPETFDPSTLMSTTMANISNFKDNVDMKSMFESFSTMGLPAEEEESAAAGSSSGSR